jgi:hypothetical protein
LFKVRLWTDFTQYPTIGEKAMIEILQTVNLLAIAILFWFVRTHVTKRVEAQAKAYGELDAKIERLPDIVAIQKEIKKGQSEVETDAYRTREQWSLSHTKRLEFLERQLTEFYWPLYWGLQKDNAVWERVLDRNKLDATKQKIARGIEQDFILPNHKEMVGIITSKIHLVDADPILEELLLAYVRHVAVYTVMRQAKIDDQDPMAQGEPWPKELFPMIEEHTNRLQEKYDRLVRD